MHVSFDVHHKPTESLLVADDWHGVKNVTKLKKKSYNK